MVADRFGDLVLEIRVGVNDVPAFGHINVFRVGAPSTSDPENQGDKQTDQLIREQKEHRGGSGHHKHHCRRDDGLTAGRPRDLLRLGAHFLQKLELADIGHRRFRSVKAQQERRPKMGIRRPKQKDGISE
jgi:hypothetical protein